jgi:hypothetical protein
MFAASAEFFATKCVCTNFCTKPGRLSVCRPGLPVKVCGTSRGLRHYLSLTRPLGPDLRAAADATRFLTSPPSEGVPEDGPTLDQSKDTRPNPIDTVIADRYNLRQEIG